jgi:hypothetical protein
LSPALEGDHDERRHVDSISHREIPITFKGPDEQDQEGFVHDELAEHSEALFFALKFGSVPLQDWVIGDLKNNQEQIYLA